MPSGLRLTLLPLPLPPPPLSSLPLLQSLCCLPSLPLQTLFLHKMDNLVMMVLGVQKDVPRGKWQSFLFVPDKNSWEDGLWLRPGAWSPVVGQPCCSGEGFVCYQKGGGELSQVKNHRLHCICLFPHTSPELLAHNRDFLNVYWRKWMNDESLPWNVSLSTQKSWPYDAQTFLTDYRSQGFCCLTTSWPLFVSLP